MTVRPLKHLSNPRCAGHLLVKLTWMWLVLAMGGICWAQPDSEGQIRDRDAQVVREYIEVRAGPSDSYLSAGRLYRNDRIRVRGRRGDNTWVRVVSGGPSGWVRLTNLSILDLSKSKPVSAGRNQRLTAYSYDEKGRRVDKSGRPIGRDTSREAVLPTSTQASLSPWLDVYVGVGLSDMSRSFGTNIDQTSFLRRSALSSVGLLIDVQAEAAVMTYLNVYGGYRDGRFATVTVRHPALAANQPLDLNLGMQDGRLGISSRYRLGALELGGMLGGRIFHRSTQEIQPTPVQIDLLSFGADLGGQARWAWRDIQLHFSSGVLLPVLVSQSPIEAGQAESSAYWVSGSVAWWFHKKWGVRLRLEYLTTRTDFSGASEHVDGSSEPGRELSYDLAQQNDTFFGFSIGIAHRVFRSGTLN